MPRSQPFTTLCQLAARKPRLDRADLHIHTTYSDGEYTPAQVVDLALRCGLCAIAITDHDTLDGIEPARQAASGSDLEVIPAVEITTEHAGKELHLLAYFVSLEAGPLTTALHRLREQRRKRFAEMVERLRQIGIHLDEHLLNNGTRLESLGRRHLAALMVKEGISATIREAFQCYLRDGGRADVPKKRLSIEEALACVKTAGGVTSWAHPPEHCTREEMAILRALGLDAVEAEYPGYREGRVKRLRAMANELGMAITGGSDCHGPESPARAIGVKSPSREELEALRGRL
jgi:predicted metal-dependent phosphoesterase TrpH